MQYLHTEGNISNTNHYPAIHTDMNTIVRLIPDNTGIVMLG